MVYESKLFFCPQPKFVAFSNSIRQILCKMHRLARFYESSFKVADTSLALPTRKNLVTQDLQTMGQPQFIVRPFRLRLSSSLMNEHKPTPKGSHSQKRGLHQPHASKSLSQPQIPVFFLKPFPQLYKTSVLYNYVPADPGTSKRQKDGSGAITLFLYGANYAPSLRARYFNRVASPPRR